MIVTSYSNFLITVVNSTGLTFKLYSLYKQQMKMPHDQTDSIVETGADCQRSLIQGESRRCKAEGNMTGQKVSVCWSSVALEDGLCLCITIVPMFTVHSYLLEYSDSWWLFVSYYLVVTPGTKAHTIKAVFALSVFMLAVRQRLPSWRRI